jgi:hypothetical protein
MSFAEVACFEIRPTSSQEIYAFVKDNQDLSDEPLRIDPVTRNFLFLPVLNAIIENYDTPSDILVVANHIYHQEYMRHP